MGEAWQQGESGSAGAAVALRDVGPGSVPGSVAWAAASEEPLVKPGDRMLT
jgi:hypothetical protein